MSLEVSTWTRRERLERIVAAERDRRIGRADLSRVGLGEAREWPARVVLALAALPEEEGTEVRAILEGLLDDWAREAGFEPFEAPVAEADRASESVLEAPLRDDELDRAFAEASVQTDEMHDVNRVAERVLGAEPVGLTDLWSDDAEQAPADPLAIEVDASGVGRVEAGGSEDTAGRKGVLATLERWLTNLERSKAGRVR